jgi:hypothetical protein
VRVFFSQLKKGVFGFNYLYEIYVYLHFSRRIPPIVKKEKKKKKVSMKEKKR